MEKRIEEQVAKEAKKNLPPLAVRSLQKKPNTASKAEAKIDNKAPKGSNFKVNLRFPLLLQIKLGHGDPKEFGDKDLVRKPDQTLIQKICVVDKGKPITTKSHRITSWADEDQTIPQDSEQIYDFSKESFVKNAEIMKEAIPVVPIQTYKLFNIYVNEKNMKVFEQHKSIP